MKLFRRKDEKKVCCDYNCTSEVMQNTEQGKKENGIKILGSGCVKCLALEKATHSAIIELGLNYEIKHITDFTQIASYGVMTTPALVFNGKVVSYGKILTVEEIKHIIETNRHPDDNGM